MQQHARRVGALSGLTLVVDDDADTRAMLREMVEDLGQEVMEAGNGQEAFDFLISHPEVRIQLILLDLDMPRMTGWELLSLLKSYVRFASIPVLVVSRHIAYLRPRDHQAIDGYIHAPAELPRLRALVEAIVCH